ncbi:MAG: ribosome biogenesis GTPase Der [Candidatus Ancaeobacter aquaticus]|nr:ribosome biogenesis GTPase Der [Candidatus Ancaeobacter aquaticus]
MDKSLVAIVGRPNVGKSALFNRLIQKRKAIVDGAYGVTRDRIFGTVQWGKKVFRIVDSGGLEFEDTDHVRKEMRSQTKAAIEDAGTVILVVDVTAGIMPLDKEVMNLLRKNGKQVILAVNKVDNDKLVAETHSFRSLGVDEIVPISALHGLGIGKLLDAVYEYVSDYEEIEHHKEIKVAIVGKPNVGKSSFVNSVLREKRVIVDGTPGTTRDAVDTVLHWRDHEFLLIDTAGMKRSKKVANAPEFYSVSRSMESIKRSDIVVLIIDAVNGPTLEDAKIADMSVSSGKGFIICVNKWDLMGQVSVRSYSKTVYEKLNFVSYSPIIFMSALNGKNVYKVIDKILFVDEQRNLSIPTSFLNKKVTEAQERVPHPYKGRKRFKIYFAAQTRKNPPLFTFFVNDSKMLILSYEKYLINQMREKFGFEGVPISCRFKNRR